MRMATFLFASVGIVLLVGCTEGPQTARDIAEPDSPFQFLDAYGAWIDYPPLGIVWQPRVAYDWRPFTDGRWIWTDRGWFWDSPEPFGWVVYHYGFWTYQRDVGWVWVPGYEWSPARVRWYEDGTMIGWAPIPPAGIDPQGNEFGWVTIQPGYFVLENVGRHVARGNRPSGNRRTEDERRPPDVRKIEQAASRKIEKSMTESETVRSGQRQIQRVRIGDRAPAVGAPTPYVGGAGTKPNEVPITPGKGSRTGDRGPDAKKDAEKRQEKTQDRPAIQPATGDRAPQPKKDTEKNKEKSQERPAVQPAGGERTGDRAPEPKKDTEKAPEKDQKKPVPEER